MSLVSYGASSSSDESDTEEPTVQTKHQVKPESQSQHKKSLFSSLPPPKSSSASNNDEKSRKKTSLFSSLPPPKSSSASSRNPPIESHDDKPGKKSSLFSSMPPPKSHAKPPVEKQFSSAADSTKPHKTKTMSSSGGSSLGLPPPKKKSQPVKISLPSIPDPDSDEDDEPVSKKSKPAQGVAGLFASLPKPRHADSNRLLIPYTLTKKKPAPPSAKITSKQLPSKKPVQPTKPTTTGSNQSKPKSLSLLVNAYDDDDDDDDDDDGSFFSLDKKDSVKPIMPDKRSSSARSKSVEVSKSERSQNPRMISSAVVTPRSGDAIAKTETIEHSVYPTSDEESKILSHDIDESATGGDRTEASSTDKPLNFTSPMQDAPLSFKSSGSGSGPVAAADPNAPLSFKEGGNQQYGYYQQASSGYVDYTNYSGQYNQPYAGETSGEAGQDSSQQSIHQQQKQSGFMGDHAFQKLMGKSKHKRGQEDIQIIDVNADDQRGPVAGTEWLAKSMTEEKEHRGKLKKEQLPSSQSKRKHQITFLAHQAKENELALKNQWANNRQTRKQTQAKYGF